MINLIPREEKERNKKVFYCRLIVLFLAMLGLSLFIGSVSMIPAYFSSNAKNSTVIQKLELQKNDPLPPFSEQAFAVVKDLNVKVSLIENAQKNQFIISDRIVNPILSKKMSGIKITGISYGSEPLKGKKVIIQGTAPSRDILLSFRLALEGDKSFKQVDLPISNFVKGSNIEFSLSLIPS